MPVMVSAPYQASSMPAHHKAVNITQFAVIYVQLQLNIVVTGPDAHARNRATCRIGTTTVVSERLTA
jgi:hypothetical protein